jgi:hypothetical protein
MTNRGNLRNKITLGDDGELHQRLDDPAYSKDAIFCVHCSAPNLPGARFCNQCGRSLIEQQMDAPISQDSDWAKNKNDQARKPKLATYDPSRYELKEKWPTSWDKLRFLGFLLVFALVYGGPMLLNVLAAVVRFVNTHPTECLLALISIGLFGATWWFCKTRE